MSGNVNVKERVPGKLVDPFLQFHSPVPNAGCFYLPI